MSLSPGMPGGSLPTPAAAAPRASSPRGGIAAALGPDEFLIAGTGMVVTFAPNGAGHPAAGLLTADEGRFVEGRWVRGLRMNGDQTHQGRHVGLGAGAFSMRRVRRYRCRWPSRRRRSRIHAPSGPNARCPHSMIPT